MRASGGVSLKGGKIDDDNDHDDDEDEQGRVLPVAPFDLVIQSIPGPRVSFSEFAHPFALRARSARFGPTSFQSVRGRWRNAPALCAYNLAVSRAMAVFQRSPQRFPDWSDVPAWSPSFGSPPWS